MTQTDTTILHLTLCDNVGPQFIQRVLTACAGNLEEVYAWSITDLIHHVGITSKKAAELTTHLANHALLHVELALIERGEAQWMTIVDPRYPAALRAIHAPPSVLYWQGSLETITNTQSLAIIGSRSANSYGARIVKTFVPPLVDAGFAIVSGGALGADSMAHRETITADGKTVAVLGSGLLHWYPKTNKMLFKEIIATGGAIVSAFPMDMQPLPENFPARNRIIAGLSRGCIVVQAAAKSGTRITAEYALQQGREVFVVPGAFDDPLSAGCHALAREGATIVTSAADVLAELGINVAQPPTEQIQQQTIAPEPRELTLADRIIAATRTPISVDELATQLNLDYDTVQQQLWDLQWRGKLQQDFTGRWTQS